MKNMERNLAAAIKRNVNNEVTGLNTDQVLAKVEDKIDANPRKRPHTSSGDREDIVAWKFTPIRLVSTKI